MITPNILHIRYFYDTVRLGSVSLAARANNVTQSAVSQGIMKLEVMLDAKLLTHSRNRIKVTGQGERLFESARVVIHSVTEMESCLKGDESDYRGHVHFACSHSIAHSVLEGPLMKFKELAPDVKVKISLGHSGIAKEWLKQGKVEFALILDNDDLSGLDFRSIYSGNFEVFQSSKRVQEPG